jgi:predicted ATP-grasp superfamily ATP-dependent carboligase
MRWNISNSFFTKGLIVSPLLGKGGSIEFLIHIRTDKESDINFEEIINQAFVDAKKLNSKYLDNL